MTSTLSSVGVIVVVLLLARFFPHLHKILVRVGLAFILGIWLMGGVGVYWVLHGLANHNVQNLNMDFGNLTQTQRSDLQIALKHLDHQALARLPLLPVLKTYVERTRILVGLPLMAHEWNEFDYTMWFVCYRQDTPKQLDYLQRWEKRFREPDSYGHAPPLRLEDIPGASRQSVADQIRQLDEKARQDRKIYDQLSGQLKKETQQAENKTVTPEQDERLQEKAQRVDDLKTEMQNDAKKKAALVDLLNQSSER